MKTRYKKLFISCVSHFYICTRRRLFLPDGYLCNHANGFFAPGVLTGYYTQCEQRGHSCDLFILSTRRKKTKPIYFVPHQQEKCHQYWPAERSARYQYFVVDPMAEYNMPQYILREFKVTDARVRASSPTT